MLGCDDAGEPHLFIENKFWAGLTEEPARVLPSQTG